MIMSRQIASVVVSTGLLCGCATQRNFESMSTAKNEPSISVLEQKFSSDPSGRPRFPNDLTSLHAQGFKQRTRAMVVEWPEIAKRFRVNLNGNSYELWLGVNPATDAGGFPGEAAVAHVSGSRIILENGWMMLQRRWPIVASRRVSLVDPSFRPTQNDATIVLQRDDNGAADRVLAIGSDPKPEIAVRKLSSGDSKSLIAKNTYVIATDAGVLNDPSVILEATYEKQIVDWIAD